MRDENNTAESMGLLTDIQITRIHKLVEQFAAATLDTQTPHQMCFSISYPLSIHLSNNGFLNSIQRGFVGMTDHYWVNLNYLNGFVVDLTEKQFEQKISHAAINGEFDFEKTYGLWSVPLINNYFDGLQISIENYIKVGIMAATILINDNNFDENNMRYVDVICTAAKRYYGDGLYRLNNVTEFLQFFELNKGRWV